MGRHQIRFEPDAHRKSAIAEDVGALDSGDGAQSRLYDPNQVVGDLVLIEIVRREAEVQRSELRFRVLDLDDRRFRLGRQIVTNLSHLRLDLGQRVVGVVVEPQVHGDGAESLGAR